MLVGVADNMTSAVGVGVDGLGLMGSTVGVRVAAKVAGDGPMSVTVAVPVIG